MTGSLADYYHWEEMDKGIRIYMYAGMVDRLQAEILQSGKEVGGILLGRTEEDRGRPVTVIEDFVPVPCSYHDGSLYDLADEDTVNLEAALLRAALAGCEKPDAPSILGYYRSHMRAGLWLSPADLQAIDSYFQAPASVFLLVKTVVSAKACTAGFFFWEDGRIQSEFSSLEVALGHTMPSPDVPADVPDLLDAAGDVTNDDLNDDLPADLTELFHQAVPQPLDVPAPLTKSSPAPPALSPPEPPHAVAAPPALAALSDRTPRVWPGLLVRAATILIATAALVISVVTYLGAPRPPRGEAAATVPAVSMLGLQVERNPPDLLVTWNRNAREIAAARRATLSILDGRFEKNLTLNKADLARGSYLYTPASDDIKFRLEVFGADDGSVAQSIRVPK
jgi:hypothetical protein